MTTTEQRERVVAAAITPELRKKVVAAALKATAGPWMEIETETSVSYEQTYRDGDDEEDAGAYLTGWSDIGTADNQPPVAIVLGLCNDMDATVIPVEHNSRFIALANPSTILAYEAALEEAEARMTQVAGDDHWWKAVIGETHKASEAGISVRHLHPMTVKPYYDAHKGTAIGDVIAGLIFEAAITRNREQFLVSDARDRTTQAEQALSALQQENERLREAAKLSEAKSDMLADSNYLAGVTAGWNAAQDGNPNEALAKIQNSRKGHIGAYRAALSRKDQAG